MPPVAVLRSTNAEPVNYRPVWATMRVVEATVMVAMCLFVCAGAGQHQIDAREMVSAVNFSDPGGLKEVIVSLLDT